jgi:hypothetical protein
MRHFPDIGARPSRLHRLFELQRQSDVQALLKGAGEASDTLRADVAMALRERAIRSLRTAQPYTSSVR